MRIGEVAMVVTSAMMTSMVNRRGVMTPRSRPMLSTINSTSPRVFIRMPSAALSRQSRPMAFAASVVPPNFPTVATTMMTPHSTQSSHALQEADLRSQTRKREERRQEHHAHDVGQALVSLGGDLAVMRNDRADQERAEDGVDADEFRGDGRQQHADEHEGQRLLADPGRSIEPGHRAHHDRRGQRSASARCTKR